MFILLVDDNVTALKVRESVLRTAGLQVTAVADAESALDLLRSGSGSEVSAVVTDHFMPQMSGAEFVCQLRQFSPTLPVLVLSGLPDVESEYEGLNVLFRQKPCPPAELVQLLLDTMPDSQHHG